MFPPTAKSLPDIDLGPQFRNSERLSLEQAHSTLWKFKQRLKKKNDDTYAMMCRLSTLVKGVIIETHYYHHGTEPYLGHVPGFAKVKRKPNFYATRLIIEQILHCKNNGPIGRICNIINK